MNKSRGAVALFGLALLAMASFAFVSRQALGFATDDSAASGGCTCSTTDNACCQAPCCRLYSRPTTEVVKEKKTCRKVECEKVAVPAITLPWEQGGSPLTLFNCLRHFTNSHTESSQCACASGVDCCDAYGSGVECCCNPQRCGTARIVRVLGKDKYEVTKCETSWEVQCVAPCSSCSGSQCCE